MAQQRAPKARPVPLDALLSPAQLAPITGESERTWVRRIARGEIRGLKLGRRRGYRVARLDLEKWLADRQVADPVADALADLERPA